ncbi:hypothetical protein [Sneathiella sp. HT1-7]|uniref:hypothetical protein n=1 Tax=Sneathiella sp. HT1-7 TaxID=2887192 RepID=UPI001D14736B|nr:hypothetical protein [Sneathiella sp. HT1-7]MCC3305535.1 hypothetical protein [Sneathiella sp. HT1-7]
MEIQNLYAGFDTLEVSFQGALPKETLIELAEAKKIAVKNHENELITIGPGEIEGHVGESGMKGGYAFTFGTGPLGELWSFKDNANPSEWNIGVKVYAEALAAYSYWEIKERLYQRLKDMGCTYGKESLRRVDFAMDFLMPDTFSISTEQFVVHHRSKISPYLKFEEEYYDTGKSDGTYVFSGGRIETVTVGKMPGRQVCVYDKRRAAISLGKLFWFTLWRIDPKDRTKNVWRVELRAGKKELKDRWSIRTFADLENSIGDVFVEMANKIRYHDEIQTDANVTRQRQHPLWDAVHEVLDRNLTDYRSGLLPNQVKMVVAEEQREIYITQIMGLVAGIAVIDGLEKEEILNILPSQVADIIAGRVGAPNTKFFESVIRAQRRLLFIN